MTDSPEVARLELAVDLTKFVVKEYPDFFQVATKTDQKVNQRVGINRVLKVWEHVQRTINERAAKPIPEDILQD